MIDIDEENNLIFPIMYDYEIDATKREHNRRWKRIRMNSLVNRTSSSLLHGYSLRITCVGRYWIHAKLLWTNFNSIWSEKKIKLPIYGLYNYDRSFLDILKSLVGEDLAIQKIKYNHDFYYAKIKLRNVIMEPCNCDICLEEGKEADSEGYFQCTHKNICDECYDKLIHKVCPFCRSV